MPLSISLSKKLTLRDSRSSLATTSFAFCFLQAASAASSCGRFTLLPLSTSVNLPAAVESPLDDFLLRFQAKSTASLLVGADAVIGDKLAGMGDDVTHKRSDVCL
jgi:hypothetical protein